MSLRIDAAADRLTAAATFPAVTAGITVTGWVKIAVDRNTYSAWLRLHSGGAGGGSTVLTFSTESDGTLGPNYFTGPSSVALTRNMAVGTWYPVAVTHDTGTTGKVYIRDGGTTYVASGAVGGGTPTGITLGGRDSTDATEWFDGDLAYFRIWSTELSQAAIEAEWDSNVPVITSGLIYNWPFVNPADLTDRVASKTLGTQAGGVPTLGSNGPIVGDSNLMTNPSADVDLTGWSGDLGISTAQNNQTAAVVRVTGLTGVPRSTGFKYGAGGGYARSAPAFTTPGQDYVMSWHLNTPPTGAFATAYAVWYNSSGGDHSYVNLGSAGSIPVDFAFRRATLPLTAPAGTVALGLIQDGSIDCIISAVQVEPASLHDYADGYTSGWEWLGTAGKSASQESVSGGVNGSVAGSLPTPTGALSGGISSGGAMAGSLPAPAGALAGAVSASGALQGSLPTPTGALAGSVAVAGSLGATLPTPGGSLLIVVGNPAALAGSLPTPGGALAGTATDNTPVVGLIAGLLPTLIGTLTDFLELVFVSPEELRIQRRNTKAFIAADPISIVLKTRTMTRTAIGGSTYGPASNRARQTFKLIMQSPAGGSIEQRTTDGTERQVDFILLGEWDADVAIGDWWEEGGNMWEVRAVIPTNGYETRAVVEAHGVEMVGG